MPMTLPITLAFTTGLAVAGAAAMAVPIAIHLLSRFRRKREPWGAMRFLVEAFRKHRRRLQLEQIILLAVRCLLLLTLGLALAGPVLGGCAGRWAGGLDASGRSVYLVLDDSLTSRATAGGEATRFGQLQRTALDVIDALEAGDTVAVFRAAVPVQADLTPPTPDLAAARAAVEAMSPRYTRGDLVTALAAVAGEVARQDAPGDRVFVVVLSDLSRAAVDERLLAAEAPSELQLLGERARLVLMPPMVGVGNVQVAASRPRRAMVLADGQAPPTASMEVTLRRFDTDAPATVTPVELVARRESGEAVGEPVRREVRWATGQTTASLNVELPLQLPERDARSTSLAIEARVIVGGSGDALRDDDNRLAIVEVRRRLTVGVVGEPSASSAATGSGFSPRQWLGLALSPGADNDPIELLDLPAARLTEPRPAGQPPLDAVFVTRPDLVPVEAWPALAEAARRGGLVWVFPPAGDGATVWGQAMTEALGLSWQIGLEAQAAPTGGDGDADALPWTLDVNAAVPESLSLLATDWVDLLRPVRVSRRLTIALREGQDTVWLALPDGPWLAAADVGEGKALLLGSAIEASWTNLATKPLWVPLLHETLRSVLGGGAAERHTAVAGTVPVLGERWVGAQSLGRVCSDAALQLTAGADGGVTLPPVPEPGLWRAMPESAGRLVAVNVDADAADTRAGDAARLGEWLTLVGRWQWLDPGDVTAGLAVEREATDLGWPLLWTVLGLALLETFLARRFSHADQGTGPIGPTALLRRALASVQARRAA